MENYLGGGLVSQFTSFPILSYISLVIFHVCIARIAMMSRCLDVITPAFFNIVL
jgi:hypothetical protein